VLGEKDPVLNFEETKEQIEGTQVQLLNFHDGHMSHIENKDEVKEKLLLFFKSI
jgi:hypothetical protein